MSSQDPYGRPEPDIESRQQRDLEYLKEMAKAPLGWPGMPRYEEPITPAELQGMLEQPVPDRSAKPWHARWQTYVALVLFVAMIAIILSLI
jgi:hypothetical protein